MIKNNEHNPPKKSFQYHTISKLFFPLGWFFCWLNPYLIYGLFRSFELCDIPDLSKSNKVEHYEAKFDKGWKLFGRIIPTRIKLRKKLRLLLTLNYSFGLEFWFAGILQFIASILLVFVPLIMKKFYEELRPKLTDEVLEDVNFYRQILPAHLRPPEDISKLGFREDNYMAWIWLLVLVVVYFTSLVFETRSFFYAIVCGLKVKTVLTVKVLQKTFKFSNKARAEYTNGVILNHVNSDGYRIWRFFFLFHYGLMSWVSVIGSFITLIFLIDWGALTSCFIGFLTIPSTMLMVRVMYRFRMKANRYQDKRISLTNEVLQGIKIIKLFGWEKPYFKVIRSLRRKEIWMMRVVFLTFSFVYSTMSSSSIFMSVLAFVTFYYVHGYLDTVTTFTALTYFHLMRLPLALCPQLVRILLLLLLTLHKIQLTTTNEFFISLKRLQKLLEAEEYSIDDIKFLGKGKDIGGDKPMDDIFLQIKDGNFMWHQLPKTEKKLNVKRLIKNAEDGHLFNKVVKKEVLFEKEKKVGKLENVNIEIQRNKLTMIAGKVGSGKSSLIEAILLNMKKTSGDINLFEEEEVRFSYTPQTPWIQNASLKDNILFGLPYDRKKFKKVVKVCSLEKDINDLKGGINIEIGEKGINLSGGQKYRIALARACYADSQVYLIDDLLSAVDAHVGNSLMKYCIMDYLKEKTVILITHQVQWLQKGDHVIVFKDGKIVEQGNYTDLYEKKGAMFELVKDFAEKKKMEKKVGVFSYEKVVRKQKMDADQKNLEGNIVAEVKEVKIDIKEVEEEGENEEFLESPNEENVLIQKEERRRGYISIKVLFAYVRAMGCLGFPAIVMFCGYVFSQTINTSSDWFLASWTSGTFTERFSNEYTTYYAYNETVLDYQLISRANYSDCNPSVVCRNESVEIFWDSKYKGEKVQGGLTNLQNILILSTFGILSLFANIGRSMLTDWFSFHASNAFHDGALFRILRSPSSFFDQTPLGRIINRFSMDLGKMDFDLILSIRIGSGLGFLIFGSLVMIVISTRGFALVVFVPLFVFYFVMYFLFRRSNLELKRLESISNSPVMSFLSETLNGLSTVRAYRGEERFTKTFRDRLNTRNRVSYFVAASERWLSSNSNLLGILLVFCVCSTGIVFVHYFPDFVAVYLIYLSITYAIVSSQKFYKTIEQMVVGEGHMNSVERLYFYKSEISSEAEAICNGDKELIQRNWPQLGKIDFDDFSVRYREELPLVLKGINCTISEREKIGIVGRTGCGKSTLILSLLRIIESSSGVIKIDNVDISSVGLETLRKRISVIPQDATLFSGTVRYNLDPFNEYSDEKVLESLRRSFMAEKISKMGGLKSLITEGGENFSAGERQLLCLSRAILKNSKILLMDECTANVDLKTDKAIQKTIREEFQDTTVLTIAHRLNTIIDSDKVLVLNDGKISELDTPKNLLFDEKYKEFKELVEETGVENSNFLKDVVLGNRKMNFGGKEKSKIKTKIDEEIELRDL